MMQRTLGGMPAGAAHRLEDMRTTEYSTDYDALRNQRETNANRLKEADMGNLGVKLADQRFKTVFPWMQQQFGNLMGQFNGSNNSSQTGNQPNVTTGPIWGNQAIQQQVNAAQGRNNMGLAAQQQALQQNMAARGFGSASPLALALGQQAKYATGAANSQAAREIPWQAAQGNAQHLLQGQQLAESQFSNRQNEGIERGRVLSGMLNPLLNMLNV